jgi:hypothetical protein
VSLLVGRGDGTLGAKTDLLTGYFPRGVAVADLNGDGNLDIAVSCGGSSCVSLLYGHGNGTFANHVDLPIPADSYNIVVTDVNGDENPDLVTLCRTPRVVSVLLGNGQGQFSGATSPSTGASPLYVAAADLNSDGKVDLVVANQMGGTASILLGHGDGSFAPKQDFGAGSLSAALTIADLNSDGRPDIAVANLTTDLVSILFNLNGVVVGVPASPVTSSVALLAPVPNPARWATALSFDLPGPGPVTLEIVDLGGRIRRVLAHGTVLPSGRHTLHWDGSDRRGNRVAAGMYFAVLRTDAGQDAQKLVVLP